jgi:hypothetical protein
MLLLLLLLLRACVFNTDASGLQLLFSACMHVCTHPPTLTHSHTHVAAKGCSQERHHLLC